MISSHDKIMHHPSDEREPTDRVSGRRRPISRRRLGALQVVSEPNLDEYGVSEGSPNMDNDLGE